MNLTQLKDFAIYKILYLFFYIEKSTDSYRRLFSNTTI